MKKLIIYRKTEQHRWRLIQVMQSLTLSGPLDFFLDSSCSCSLLRFAALSSFSANSRRFLETLSSISLSSLCSRTIAASGASSRVGVSGRKSLLESSARKATHLSTADTQALNNYNNYRRSPPQQTTRSQVFRAERLLPLQECFRQIPPSLRRRASAMAPTAFDVSGADDCGHDIIFRPIDGMRLHTPTLTRLCSHDTGE